MKRSKDSTSNPRKTVRFAIYTRVSNPDQANGNYTSIDNQRDQCEAYITSQKHENSIYLTACYNDTGLSGSNLNRPALKKLLDDIKAGEVDCLVVHKIDRLSRSVPDFYRLYEIFKKYNVELDSVTETIDGTTANGIMMQNVNISIAQFFRDQIAERTRDKMSSMRKKGMWTGGCPVLGYDVHPDGGRLVVNEGEASQTQAIFALYLHKQSLTAVAEELGRRGWTMKSWTTRAGHFHRGRPFTKANLYRLLSNPVYTGQVRHRGKIYAGEHSAIIDPEVFEKVHALLRQNGNDRGARVRNRYGALLKGILRCAHCDAAMTPNNTRKGNKLYRYYCCTSAQQKSWKNCPTRSISAPKIERFVIGKIRIIGQDPALIQETAKQVIEAKKTKKPPLVAEQKRLKRELTKKRRETRRLLDALATGKVKGAAITEKLSELEEHSVKLEKRITEIQEKLVVIEQETFNLEDLTKALGLFHPIWEVLYPIEQARIIQLLIAQIDFHGGTNTLGITFRSTGIKALASEIDEAKEAAPAQ